jgi:uncharacterized protein involved in type VI secretion and phage assembly
MAKGNKKGELPPTTQKNRRIKISTVLDHLFNEADGDPLLPAIVQISEAVSTPYYIDLLMYARRELREIKPQEVINTAATVSVRVESFPPSEAVGQQKHFTYQLRKGVFQSFQRQDRFHRRVGVDLNVYSARLVPAFLIMDQEVRYRIFEQPNLTFCELIQTCMTRFKGLNLSNYVEPTALAKLKALQAQDPPGQGAPPPMEHAVQYGESTYNFLSRLMARFSLWYYFDHDGPGPHEQLVLGYGPFSGGTQGFKKCTVYDNIPDPRDPLERLKHDNWLYVSGIGKTYTPAPRLTRTSDFNPLFPTDPPQSNDDDLSVGVDSGFDIINAADGSDKRSEQCTPLPQTTFIQEQFPDSTIYADGDATSDAGVTMSVAEGQVFTATAVTRNASFCAARRFNLLKGDDNTENTEYLITRMSLNAYDRYYVQFVHHDTGLAALLDDVLVAPIASLVNQATGSDGGDLANAMSNAGLQEYASNWVENPPTTKPPFEAYFGAGAVAYLASFLPATTTVLQDLLRILRLIFVSVVEVIRKIADVILFLPGALIPAVGRARDAMDDGIRTFETSISEFITRLVVRDDDACGVSFVGVPTKNGKFSVPLPVARNAQIFGPHLATVIGPKGIDTSAGDLWADALGRVRVRFPWDRTPWEGTQANPQATGTAKQQFAVDGNTVWVRVSEAWAGQNFGTQFLPRIGQEVVVSFIDSDPDRPLITGRVYNASGGNVTNLPFPDPASATKAIDSMDAILKLNTTGGGGFTRSGIETRSTPVPKDGKPGYHLLRFDDSYGNEQLLMRSQARMDVTARASHYDTTIGDRHILCVSGYDKTTNKTSNGDLFVTTGYSHFGTPPHGNYDLHVGGSRFEQVDGPDFGYQLTVKKDFLLDVEQNYSAIIKGNLSINAKNIVLEASQKITLRVGQSTLVLSPSTHYLDGPMICKQQDGPADPVPDLTFQNVADAAMADPGEPPGLRAGGGGDGGGKGGKGGGGGRGTHQVTAQHALSCGMDSDSMVSVDMPQLCGADDAGP